MEMDVEKALEGVKKDVLAFLQGDEAEAERWYQEALRQGTEARAQDQLAYKPPLANYVVVALTAMLMAARFGRDKNS